MDNLTTEQIWCLIIAIVTYIILALFLYKTLQSLIKDIEDDRDKKRKNK